VEVQFLTRGLPGFRAVVAVRRCPAFEPPEAVVCAQRCLDPVFRRLWGPLTVPAAQEEAPQ
jgi:hypothetical protein